MRLVISRWWVQLLIWSLSSDYCLDGWLPANK